MIIVVADAVSEGKSIAKNKSDIGRDAEASVFARTRSSNQDLLALRAGKHKTQINTLLILCSEKRKSGALEPKVKHLTQQVADILAAQEIVFIERQAMKNAVSANEVSEKQALSLKEELSGAKTTKVQKFLVRSNEIEALKVQLVSAIKRMDDAEDDRDGTMARLQQF